jgi:hypothetical protein
MDAAWHESEREELRGDEGLVTRASDGDPAEAVRTVCPGCGAALDRDEWSCHACGAPAVPKSPPRARHRPSDFALQERASHVPRDGGRARSSHDGKATTPRSPRWASPSIVASGAVIVVVMLVLAYVLRVGAR